MPPAQRAAVRHSITVNTSQENAFATFTSGHDRWWPREFHIGGAELEEAVIEGREGGRWYERDVDGTQCDWGKVLVWDPISRLVLAWQITGEWAYDADLLTEVEVRFIPDGPDHTRFELEHRGSTHMVTAWIRCATTSIQGGPASSKASQRPPWR